MTKVQRKNSALLLLTAVIWGTAFVAQSEGGDAIGPLSFNCIRSFIGAFALMIALIFLDKAGFTHKPVDEREKKQLYKGGILCGIFLCLATNAQQLGISSGTAAGKAGFLTACYILIVPVLGIFLGRKCNLKVWVGVVIALLGLYMLCIDGKLYIESSDLMVIACAFLFSFQILLVDHYAPGTDGVRMSCIQFFTCGVLTFVPMIFCEIRPGWEEWLMGFANSQAWISLLYAGIFSSGIAYTLQIVGQQDLDPTIASLLMSLESVFSVIAGWIILGEALSRREILGCILLFAAIVLAQLPEPKKSE